MLFNVTDVSIHVCSWPNLVLHDTFLLGVRFGSAARQHNVGCIVPTYSICHVSNCVLISSAAVCFYSLCCMQGTPTEHSSSMCMCSVLRSRRTPTVESMTAGPHQCYYHEQDATETCDKTIHGKTVRSSNSSNISEERFYCCRSRTQYTAFTVSHLRMLASVATCVVIHVSASPKLFVVLVMWARFHHSHTSHLQICVFLFAMVHWTSRSRSMRDPQP